MRVTAPDISAGAAYEAKLDGYRWLVGKTAASVTLWSRRGTLFTSRFPEIAQACDKLPPETVVDGEVVAIDDNGRASFNRLQHQRSNRHLQFYAFDLPVYRGRSLLHVPLETRRGLLEEALEKVDYPVLFSRTFDAKPADLIRAAKELQLERIIAKQKDSSLHPVLLRLRLGRTHKQCFVLFQRQFNAGESGLQSHEPRLKHCIGITRDVMKMLDEGKTLKQMRAQIEKTYSKYGPSTPTPPVP